MIRLAVIERVRDKWTVGWITIVYCEVGFERWVLCLLVVEFSYILTVGFAL